MQPWNNAVFFHTLIHPHSLKKHDIAMLICVSLKVMFQFLLSHFNVVRHGGRCIYQAACLDYLLSNCNLINSLSHKVVWYYQDNEITNILPVPTVNSRGQLWACVYRYNTGWRGYTESSPKPTDENSLVFYWCLARQAKNEVLQALVRGFHLFMYSLPLLVHSQLC